MTITMGNPSTTAGTGNSFGSLASSALPSLGGDSLSRPTWNRSLQELAASNMALMRTNGNSYIDTNAIAPPTAAAQMLLGSRTDFGSLLQKSGGKSKPKEAASRKSLPDQNRFSFDDLVNGGIEAVVRRHRDGILERVHKDQREQTQRLLDKAVERQIEDDWKEERKWWRNELAGDRNLVDATNFASSGKHGLKPRVATLSGGSSTTLSRGMLVPLPNNNKNNNNGCDAKIVKEHLNLVKQIKPESDPLSVIAGFEQLANNTETFGEGYKNAWMMLTLMLPRMQSPIHAAQGAQSHFCKQYQTFIYNYVKRAGLSGQDIATPVNYVGGSTTETIASYVKLVSGSNASVWEILYFCLRCGDANAANAVLRATPAGREDFLEQPILSQVIGQLSSRQGSASCMFEVGSPMIMSQDRFAVLDLYEKTKNLEPSNKHKLSVLALLCGHRLESFSTLEDYLFGCLWLALMDKENPIRQLEVMGASIRKYGPSHFASNDNGEWGYVLPLIAAQQFETALSYLAEAGGPSGLMQATHLGIVFSLAGVRIADQGNNDSLSSGGSAPRDVVTALLVNYATLSEREPTVGVLTSLEYLLKIPSAEESIYQIANLIHRTPGNQIEILTGVLDAVGNRKNAFLDGKLPEESVSSILVNAAELFKKHASDRSTAMLSAKLFMLGYSHTKVVQLLNEMISPVNIFDEEKDFWTIQSNEFYNAYLSKRTSALASIEREGKLDLVRTNRSLLELRSFFDSFRLRRFEEAFLTVIRTGLLPRSEEELNEKNSQHRDLEPILKETFPVVVSATVQCLCELFHGLRSESRGALPPVVQDRLRELLQLAKVLFKFAGVTNLPSSCKNDITRMRANMII